MNLTMLYRVSMYLMLVLATVLLSVDAGEFNSFAFLYPIGVAVAACAALATVDRNPELGLPRDLANFLAMGSFVLAAMEYWASSQPQAQILALGHWLVYLQLVKMFLPKTEEDDWFLFMLALVQVLVGAFLSQSDTVGTLLVTWAIVAMWTMSLFHLYRESQKNRVRQGIKITPTPDPKRPYPGLVNFGFVTSSLLVAISTLCLGGMIFLIMPRWSGSRGSQGAPAGTRHLTGFSDQVQLGQMGEILENDGLVMTVELLDNQRRPVRPEGEPYWRGVTLVNYSAGRWLREGIGQERSISSMSFPIVRPETQLRQHIKMEATSGDVIFSMRPVWGATGRLSGEMAFNDYDGTLYLKEPSRPDASGEAIRRGSIDYDVYTLTDSSVAQPYEGYPDVSRLEELTMVPTETRRQLLELSEQILSGSEGLGFEERAHRLERYLRDTGGYFYSLRMLRPEAHQDPVLNFLLTRKEGHCEYFASGLALLLRSQGIPARIVNGFKGGDWNDLVRVTNVREKHAHSWVEALVGRTGDSRPRWIRLDPTPSREREQVVARVGGMAPQFRTISDALRHIWVFYVSGFDQDRQDRLIYAPVRQLLTLLGRGFLIVSMVLSRIFGDFFRFSNIQDVVSIKGFLVSVTLMLAATGLFLLGQRFVRWASLRIHGARSSDEMRLADFPFLMRLQRAFASIGVVRSASETPREFAQRAREFLIRDPNLEDGLSQLPDRTVDAFYGVRFGQHELAADTAHWLDERLDALEATLNQSSQHSERQGASI
jgi:transglutaminase-like putative cysteine protease